MSRLGVDKTDQEDNFSRADDRSRNGALAFDVARAEDAGLAPAADSISPPKLEPRTVSKHFVVPSIGSQKVGRTKWSGIGQGENTLQVPDFGNSLVGIHPCPSSSRKRGLVKSGVGQRHRAMPLNVAGAQVSLGADA